VTDAGKPFRKLPERPATSFLRLPAWVRGYADEIVRIAERPSGRICSADGALDDIAFAIRAHASEVDQLKQAIEMLLKQGELVIRDGLLWYADFAVTQRNYEAARKAAQRQRDRVEAGGPTVPDSPASPGQSGTVPQDQRRSDQIDPPLPPEHGGRVRKVRPKAEDPEERRRRRGNLVVDAESGFYGPELRERLKAAVGEARGKVVDELERGQHQKVPLRLALP
jgi:hypothetical protein